MQFEVAAHRLEHEFGATAELTTTGYQVARLTDEASATVLRAMSGVRVLVRADGALLALFESPYWLARLEAEQPALRLDRLVAEGMAG
jgi:peptide chain release factor 3